MKHGHGEKPSHTCLGEGFRDGFLVSPFIHVWSGFALACKKQHWDKPSGVLLLQPDVPGVTGWPARRDQSPAAVVRERLCGSQAGREAIMQWPGHSHAFGKIWKTKMWIIKQWQLKPTSHRENSQLRDPSRGHARAGFEMWVQRNLLHGTVLGIHVWFYGFRHSSPFLILQISLNF